MTSAYKQLTEAGLNWDEVEYMNLKAPDPRWGEPEAPVKSNSELLDLKFDDGYGGVKGPSLLVYTKDTIYFTCCYDGAEWVESIPRNPDPTFVPQHYGGG